MTDTISTNVSTGVVLTDPAYGNPVTVAAGVTVSGDPTGITAASSWTVQNLGTITSSHTDYTAPVLGDVYVPPFYVPGFGTIGGRWYPGTITTAYTTITGTAVDLEGGGGVFNAAAGDIAGGSFGVKIAGAAGKIDNSGTISASGYYYHPGAPVGSLGVGAYLSAGGTVTNHDGGTISGVGWGIEAVNVAATVVNAGSIGHTGTIGGYDGVRLAAGGSVTNMSTGTISGFATGVSVGGIDGTVINDGQVTGVTGVYIDSSTSALLDNSGMIAGNSASGAGVAVGNAGSSATIINELTGTITGFQGVKIQEAGAVNNYGTISGTRYGVELDLGGSVTNGTLGAITGGVHGVDIAGAAGTIGNAGTITGTTGMGVDLAAGGSVTNASTGTIAGVTYGVRIAGSAGSVDNLGTITGGHTISTAGGTYTSQHGYQIGGRAYDTTITSGSSTVTGTAVELDAGGAVTNAGGDIFGATYGVKIAGGVGTVNNSGTITGYSTTYRSAVTLISVSGFDMTGHATYSTVVTPSYMMTTGIAVDLAGGGSVTNAAGGDIAGGTDGVRIAGTAGTVENAGTIAGGTHAVDLEASGANRLIVDSGAVFTGNVVANATAANTLELTSGTSAGTISGLGVKYQGFQTVTIDSGATWTIGGTEAGIGTTTIQGFNTHDTLDITDLTFASGDTVNINDTTDILTILGADGTTVLDTIQLAGNFAGKFFHLSDDGTHGSYIQEDGTPCYCRGTLILTDRGEVPVEYLKIGDRLVTRDGGNRPIRWIGTRAYDGRFLAGNKNVLPVLITAGALADNVPKRDLWVSPLHAMYLDDVLIPAFILVNGTSIVQAASVSQVEYFHLELETHDVIVAEGALAESFLDDDSRGMFHNAPDYARLYPGAGRKPAAYCAPIVEDGAELESVRRRLSERAEILISEADYSTGAVPASA